MKRSVMLKIIADEIYDTTLDQTEDLCMAQAEFILKIVEDNGMLPPRHHNVSWELQEEPHQDGYHGLNGWEPEE